MQLIACENQLLHSGSDCLLTCAVMTKSYDSILGSSTRAWKFQRMELVLQYSRSSAWIHPISVVAEPVVAGVLNYLGSKWTARSGSLAKMLNDVPFDQRKMEWESFYDSDKCMAAMHQEVFHEAMLDLAPSGESHERLRAQYMRRCADLVVRMTAKRNAS